MCVIVVMTAAFSLCNRPFECCMDVCLIKQLNWLVIQHPMDFGVVRYSSSCGHVKLSIKGIIKASAHCQALIWLGDGGALGLVASSESNLKPVQTPNRRHNHTANVILMN